MAAITGAALAAGTALYSARQQSRAGDRAANAAQQGSAAEIAERARQFDLARQDSGPWREAGQTGLTGLLGLLKDPNSIQDSQAYQWRFDQGLQARDRSAAARGSLFSGGHSADLTRFGQGLASQEYGDQWNRLAGLAGVGQSVNSQMAGLGANMANANANSIGNATAARQSSYLNSGAANAGAAGALGGIFNNWYQQRNANSGGGGNSWTGQALPGQTIPNNNPWWG